MIQNPIFIRMSWRTHFPQNWVKNPTGNRKFQNEISLPVWIKSWKCVD
jgi:hypothetical protein